jgi:hypothetical protein
MAEELVGEEKKLSLLSKYPREVLMLLLIVGMTLLWKDGQDTKYKVEVLQSEMKTYLKEDGKRMLEILQENTLVMKEVKVILIQNNKK